MDYKVQQRVLKILEHAKDVKSLEGTDRKAARMLFSCFADLEMIAVKAAERGDAIENQLEDELVHHYAFYTLAESLGGKLETPESIQKLLDFLNELRGEMSLVLLNITAESWLEVFLHSLSKAGICDGLFAEIEKDEARHSTEAFKLKVPDPKNSKPLMRNLENLFVELTRDPKVVLPIIHFSGQNACAKAVVNVVKAHKKACKHLKIPVSKDIHEVERTCKEALAVKDPKPLKLNTWQIARLKFWNDQTGNCLSRFFIPWEGTLIKFELELGRAVSYALDSMPHLNRTTANGKLYQCSTPVIGFRRRDKYDRVFTVYEGNAHTKDFTEVHANLQKASERVKSQPYCAITEWREYEDLQPAPRSAAIITNVGVFDGIPFGFAPLIPAEGASFLFTTNNIMEIPVKRKFLPWPKWQRVVPVCLQIDHRTMDGHNCGEIVERVKEWFAISKLIERN